MREQANTPCRVGSSSERRTLIQQRPFVTLFSRLVFLYFFVSALYLPLMREGEDGTVKILEGNE